MQPLGHRVTGGEAEVRVLSQYLDGELHLVYDSLSGAVATVEQFEVAQFVIGSVAIPVMDGFLGEQIASDVLRHDVAVLEHRVFDAGDEAGHSDVDVAVPFDVFADVTAFEFNKCLRALMRGFAFLIAVFLLFVNSTAWFAAFRVFVPAFKASERMLGITGFSAPYARTLARAIQRVSSIFFVIRGDKGFHHGKAFSALNTGEVHGCLSFRDSFVKAVRTSTGETAVFPVFTRKAGKRLLAVFTDFLNRHGMAPLFGDEGIMLLSIGNVK